MVSSNQIIKIGTRGSRLALRQAQIVADFLKKEWPKFESQIQTISSVGDLNPDADFKELSDKQGKGIFTKALDEALLQKKVDVAVHSLKDLPVEMVDGLELGAVLQREDPRDAWISKDRKPFEGLEQGATVGTSSVRRAAQLKQKRPDLRIVPLRGNVDTRIQKLKEENDANGGMDGIVIALAGVRRVGLEKEITEIFPVEWMIPAIGQGVIALVIRGDDEEIKEKIVQVNHPLTYLEIQTERVFLAKLGGGCHVPIAGVAQMNQEGGVITLRGGVFSPDGKQSIKGTLSAPKTEAVAMAERLAQMLLHQGADKLLQP